MIESDEACDALDGILAVEGIDMVTVGPMDWAVGLGLFGDEARARQAPKIERVLKTAAEAGRITPDHRAVVVLRMIQEYSTRETAEALDIPEGTVLSRLSRGMANLKGILQGRLDHEDE